MAKTAATMATTATRGGARKSPKAAPPAPGEARTRPAGLALAPARSAAPRPAPAAAIPAAAGIEQLTAPSIRNIRAVYQALRDSVELVDRDSRAVLEALQLLGETLSVARGSATLGGGLGLGLLGPMALPIPLAVRAVMAPVSKYVQQRTGISLYGWIDFVGSTQKQFEDYLAQLERVAALAAADAAAHEAVQEAALVVAAEPSGDRLRADEALLRETKAKTAVWRPVLAQFAQFGHALDALLDGWRAQGGHPDGGAGRPVSDGWAENLGGLFQGAATKVTDQLAGARQLGHGYLLSAFSDLGERAERFRSQVAQLSQSFTDLEDLLDLEIAQLRARAGELSAEEVELLRRRVAATVLVPRLVQRLAAARAREAAWRARLRKLEEVRGHEAIGDEVHATLAAEYEAALAAATAQTAALEGEAAVWRAHGRPMLEDAAARLRRQEELVRVRRLVGELPEGAARERTDSLARELSKVEAARRALDVLTPPSLQTSTGR